ncbi:DUF2064 domain-containing protein [candidate division GN15 bacterium]|nr:DUF2064 domain-containing protein [candidate division GN15 bacterium]
MSEQRATAPIGVGVMAKLPRIGHVKTRLARSIGDEAALSVYEALLLRACRLVSNLDATTHHRSLHATPPDGVAWFQAAYGSRFDRIYPQRGRDLGERMYHALESLLVEETCGKAILIGTDIPDISPESFTAAARELESHDLVLGPTDDGGYYLIGMRRPIRELFVDIDWGTVFVFDQTVRVVKDLGISLALLPILRDLDNNDDYRHFRDRGLID